MANPFTANGAIPDKQSRFAPLYVNRFWSGLYTNSNPLSEAATPFLYQKFYSGSRFETLRGGQNVEVSPRLTLIRRPGSTVYNTQTFTSPNTFYSFRQFNQTTLQPQISVLVDTPTAVYDGTGPSTKNLLFTKQTGAGQTSFQSVGNTLYAGDGVSTWKYLWNPPWQANTTYSTGSVIIDTNGNLQLVTQINAFAFTTQPFVNVTNNICTISWTNGGAFTGAQLANLPGTPITFANFVSATFLNGGTSTISAVSNFFTHITGEIASMVFPFTNANYNAQDTGGTMGLTVGSAVSGGTAPSWNATIGHVTLDSELQWTNMGPAVQNWGINPPSNAPTVSNVALPSGTAWAASTYYWPASSPVIIDSNGNIQVLTTAGTTGTSVPTWATSAGVTTADSAGGGTAVWTCGGSATRAISTGYTLASYIAVTVTTTYKSTQFYGGQIHIITTQISNYYLFQCSVAGTTSSTATASIAFPATLGGSVTDGGVQWTNVGYQVTRTSSSTSSPSNNTKGNVSNSTKVALVSSIVDNAGSGGGTGYAQNVTLAGQSGSSAPTWAVNSNSVEAAGLVTTDGGVKWTNAGPVSAANSGSWVYAYSFYNPVSKEESSLSPLSTPIILQASSLISITGNGDPDWNMDGVNSIRIYRSVQGFKTPFFLTQIAAPAQGAPWTYADASPDPPNPAAILDEFIVGDTTGNNAPPPAGLTNLTYYLNRIFGSVGTFGYYSGTANQAVGVGASSFGGLNFYQMPESISQQWPSATGLLIFTIHGVYFSQGVDSNGNPNSPVRLLEDIGLLTPNLFTVNGSIPTIFTSDNQMIALDPSSGVSRISDPIADILGTYSNTASYLTWHVNGIDSAYFIANGSTGWYRLAPTSAPESGSTWSTQGLPVGGVKCVKSVETSPGVKKFLMGPTVSGQILYRDLTTNADAGTSYAASVIIGSIVFAQPNQCAEIESITTTARLIGSAPSVAILGDEISGTFETLTQPVPDPPFLVASKSTYSQRWYFSTLKQPAWMRHMQLQLSWPAENAANEIIEYSIYGAIHTES